MKGELVACLLVASVLGASVLVWTLARVQGAPRARDGFEPVSPASSPPDPGAPPALRAARQPVALEAPGGATDTPGSRATLATIEASVWLTGSAGGPDQPLGPVQLILRHGARELERSSTDARGGLRRSGLVSGRYSLEVASAGLAPGLVAAPSELTGTTRVPFTLAPGRTRSLRLFVEEAGQVSGVALDAAGLPLCGARLRLRGTDLESDAPLFEVRSDSGGRFAFEALPPREYCCVLTPPVLPGVQGQAAPLVRVVTVAPGQARRLILRCEPGAGVVRGRLVDESGRPLEGLVVRAERSERMPSWSRVLARTRTDADGRFRLAGLPAALVELRAAPRLGSGRGFVPARPAFEETFLGAQDLRVAPGDQELGEIRLLRR